MNQEIPQKPASEIMPARRPVDQLDADNVRKLTYKYWSMVSAQHDINFSKGCEIGKNHLQSEEVAHSLLLGVVKVIFEEIKAQIDKDNIHLEKKQRQLVRANAVYETIIKQIDLIKALNFKLDPLLLQAILQGFTTSFLLIKAHDTSNKYQGEDVTG